MSIESNPQPQPSPETNPFSATPEEIAAREQLFAPDEDYSSLPADHTDPIEASQENPAFEIPQLEDRKPHDPAPSEKIFKDNPLPAHQIPQLEPLEPRHRLQD